MTGVDELLEDLKRIPTDIDSRVYIDEITEQIMNKIRKKINLT